MIINFIRTLITRRRKACAALKNEMAPDVTYLVCLVTKKKREKVDYSHWVRKETKLIQVVDGTDHREIPEEAEYAKKEEKVKSVKSFCFINLPVGVYFHQFDPYLVSKFVSVYIYIYIPNFIFLYLL